jgi:hypothetical protein
MELAINNKNKYVRMMCYGLLLSILNTASIAYIDGTINIYKVLMNAFLFAGVLWYAREHYPLSGEFSSARTVLAWLPLIVPCLLLMEAYYYYMFKHIDLVYMTINAPLMAIFVIIVNKYRYQS